LLGLVAQVSRFLSDSGSQPSHREGPNAIYGHHLLLVLRSEAAKASVAPTRVTSPSAQPSSAGLDLHGLVPAAAQEPTGVGASSDSLFMPWPPAFAAAAGLGLDGSTTAGDGLASWAGFDWLLGDASGGSGAHGGSGGATGGEPAPWLGVSGVETGTAMDLSRFMGAGM
jgi:hypothetical protein